MVELGVRVFESGKKICRVGVQRARERLGFCPKKLEKKIFIS